MSCTTRRAHLCWWGKLLTSSAVLALPSCQAPSDPLPTPSTFESLVLSFEHYPALKEIGGVATVDQPELLLSLILVRLDANRLISLWRICPHGACDVTFERAAQELVCPCHGSRFDVDGNLLLGPAERPLTSYATSFDTHHIYITSHIPV